MRLALKNQSVFWRSCRRVNRQIRIISISGHWKLLSDLLCTGILIINIKQVVRRLPQTAIIMLCKCLFSPIICHYSNDRIRKWFKDVSVNIFGRNCDTYEKQKAFYPIVFAFSCPTKTQRIGRDNQVTLRSFILWHAATVIIFSFVGIKGNRIMRF